MFILFSMFSLVRIHRPSSSNHSYKPLCGWTPPYLFKFLLFHFLFHILYSSHTHLLFVPWSQNTHSCLSLYACYSQRPVPPDMAKSLGSFQSEFKWYLFLFITLISVWNYCVYLVINYLFLFLSPSYQNGSVTIMGPLTISLTAEFHTK